MEASSQETAPGDPGGESGRGRSRKPQFVVFEENEGSLEIVTGTLDTPKPVKVSTRKAARRKVYEDLLDERGEEAGVGRLLAISADDFELKKLGARVERVIDEE